jgi:hypothetical protein
MMDFDKYYNKNYIIAYRGVNKDGMDNIRPSDDGVYGSGIYFYDNPLDARAYAGIGGGIIIAKIKTENMKYFKDSKIILIPSTDDIMKTGFVPVDETLTRQSTLNAIEREEIKL